TCDSRGAWLQAQPFERESPQEEAWRQRALRDLETYNRLLLARVQQSPVTLSDTDRGRFGRALAVIYRESSPEACAAAAEDILRCTTGVSRFSVESAAGTAYYVAGDWGRARELLDNALRRRPHHVATRYTLAFACVAAAADRMRKDDPRPSLEEALRHLEMLAAEEPARAVFSVFCAQVRCGLATLARPPSAELLAEALRDVEKALQMDASLSLAWMVRGNIWVARADRPDADAPEALGRARESYERALELDPNDLSTRVNLASILLDMAESHAADALRHFDQVIQRNDTIPAAWLGRASARRLMARPIVDQDGDPRSLYDEVERDCGRAIELLPKDPAAYCLRAQMWADRARFEMTLGDQTDRWWNLAVQDLQRAIELDPEYVLAVNNLGSVYQSKATTQDLDAPRSIALLDMSIATYTRALDALKSGARRVTRADVLEGRASAYRNRARAMEDPEPDLQRSLSDYDEAIERAPKSAGLLHGRGVTWCDRGVARQRLGQDPREDYRRAAEDLRQAIALGGEGARVRLDLACALGNLAYFTRSRSEPAQELYESAMREYDRAVEQNPKNPEIRFLRGKMRLLWGELRSALDGFRESAALDPRWAAACEPYIQRCEAALRTN
ncbi:MAG: hypothetical protein HYY16_12370, partial [Planctomycetes bacterium]|nr:hypothetical protein [Planctomycetota bacterium]